MYFTDDPVMDAENYYEEQEERSRKAEAKAPICCICHKSILDDLAYKLDDDYYAHEECVKKEFKKIDPDLADAAEEALQDSMISTERFYQ